MKDILCFSNEGWSSTPGRTQQLISRLREARVLYFSPPDPSGGLRGDRAGRKVRPNITAYTLPAPLWHGIEHSMLASLFHRRLRRFVVAKAVHHRFTAPLLWTTSPKQAMLLDILPYDGLVYDCSREWDDMPQWEGRLASTADIVFAASPLLARRLSPCSANIALLPNGVNHPLFAAPDQTSPNRLLPEVTGPVFGWAGTIGMDLDLSPLIFAAREQPDWTFLLLGRRARNPQLRQLSRLPNVILSGPCPLSEVPEYLHRCDVLVNLLPLDQPDESMIPIRLYEYLSTGKPIVSMLWPDQVELFPDVIYGAHSHQEFHALCRRALEEAPGFVVQRRRDHGASAAWSLRTKSVAHILKTTGLL